MYTRTVWLSVDEEVEKSRQEAGKISQKLAVQLFYTVIPVK